MEHLTSWPTVRATHISTVDIIALFVSGEILHPFSPAKQIVSDNAGCFNAGGYVKFDEGRRRPMEARCGERPYIEWDGGAYCRVNLESDHQDGSQWTSKLG